MTNLITIESVVALRGKKAIETLSSKEALKPLVDHVRKEALSVQHDVTTDKGRKAVGTAANNVVQSRKPIVDAIDKHLSDINQTVSGLREAKSYIENEFKLIKSEVLKPRAEWQAEQDKIEEERKAEIRERIQNIRNFATLRGQETRSDIETMIVSLEQMDLSQDFGEFTQEAMQVRQDCVKALSDEIMKIIEREAQKKQAIESSISQLKAVVSDAMDWFKPEIKFKMDWIEAIEIDEYFGDRQEEAAKVKADTLNKLKKLHAMAEDEPEEAPEPKETEPMSFEQFEEEAEKLPEQGNSANTSVTTREVVVDWFTGFIFGDEELAENLVEQIELGNVPGVMATFER